MLLKMIWRNALRHKLRTLLTIFGVAVAIMAFSFLRTVISAWYAGAETASSSRIITRSKVSLVVPLPLAYQNKLASVPHVTQVTHMTWFQGTYIDEANFFAQFAIDPEVFFSLYPEYQLPPEQLKTFQSERNAVVVGEKLAEQFGWKLGQQISLEGTIYPGQWDFVIRGIYKGAKPNTVSKQMFFHWNYLDQTLQQQTPGRAGLVGLYVMTIDDPNQAASVGQVIDAQFANSEYETLTETENAFQLSFVAMSSAIIEAVQLISFVIIFIIFLVLANTMMMSARERTAEYAVLKTLGFQRGFISTLIVGESLILVMLGGALGLAITFPICRGFETVVGQFFDSFEVTSQTLVWSAGAALVLGVVAAVLPLRQVMARSIVDGLRQIG